MSRRRLQIICSSDEEDDEPQQLLNNNEENENPNNNNNNIEIEILESSTNLQSVTLSSSSTPNPTPNHHEPPNVDVVDAAVAVAADCSIGRVLEGLGLRLRRDWLESCVRGLEGSVREFTQLDDNAKAKFCFEQFLYSDMNYCGAGWLPRDVHKLHLVDLKGPFVLQVDEIVNISCPLRDRYQKAAAGIKRCLKLSMTDGIQHVFGMEYRPIKDLDVLAPSGLKVAICNVHVRHGLLMLVPEVIEVLGGMVEELEQARQRLVNEINKPPRGKRTRTGVVPPLATRATNAAWPPEGVTAPEHTDTASRESSIPFQVHQQGTAFGIATSAAEEIRAIYRENAEPGLPSAATITTPVNRRDAEPNFPSTAAVSVPFNMKDTGPSFSSDAASLAEDIPMVDMATEDIDVPIRREHNEPILLSSSPMEVEEFLSDGRNSPAAPASGRSRESVPVSLTGHNVDTEPDLVDELELPIILSGDNENPFTYLASLSAKQAGMNGSASTVTGKIKVVQKEIGFSPAEVTTALDSSDGKRISHMKETLKRFQKFLVNFEGTMLVQLNEESPIPVAIEMNQGCPASDAWLLLKRLKPATSQPHHLHPETINLSP
ncbi:recQ-mediated genome instability protein 1 isoform X2 [Nicotiana tomentosiformis]|uniref:recQ-mediated genome instability protein 1 isoform X2 n=1 Tax=Nicotiana tomentosiformis TaxID=4098 RepID=UPI000878C3F1|nr:recQ-mediated genome instability protein 1 isoform X2 [Nicotiana tomentosiformis]